MAAWLASVAPWRASAAQGGGRGGAEGDHAPDKRLLACLFVAAAFLAGGLVLLAVVVTALALRDSQRRAAEVLRLELVRLFRVVHRPQQPRPAPEEQSAPPLPQQGRERSAAGDQQPQPAERVGCGEKAQHQVCRVVAADPVAEALRGRALPQQVAPLLQRDVGQGAGDRAPAASLSPQQAAFLRSVGLLLG